MIFRSRNRNKEPPTAVVDNQLYRAKICRDQSPAASRLDGLVSTQIKARRSTRKSNGDGDEYLSLQRRRRRRERRRLSGVGDVWRRAHLGGDGGARRIHLLIGWRRRTVTR